MKTMDEKGRSAAYDLFESGTQVTFIIESIEASDPDGTPVQIQLRFPRNSETGKADIEWGALGFLFIIGILSFADASPFGPSASDYDDNDTFGIDDLLKGLRWEGSTLRFSAEDVRGRPMKTTVILQANGTGTLSTTGRGMTAQRWLHCLQGKAGLRLVSKDQQGYEIPE